MSHQPPQGPQTSLDNSNLNDLSRLVSNTSFSSTNGNLPGGLITTQNISTVIKPKENSNSMKFVKITPPDLSKKAVEQIRIAQESKITKEKLKEVEEDWQSNLLKWKSKRRQHFVGPNATDDNEDEANNNDNNDNNNLANGSGRKVKTFAQIIEQRARAGNRLNFNLQRYIGSEDEDERGAEAQDNGHDNFVTEPTLQQQQQQRPPRKENRAELVSQTSQRQATKIEDEGSTAVQNNGRDNFPVPPSPTQQKITQKPLEPEPKPLPKPLTHPHPQSQLQPPSESLPHHQPQSQLRPQHQSLPQPRSQLHPHSQPQLIPQPNSPLHSQHQSPPHHQPRSQQHQPQHQAELNAQPQLHRQADSITYNQPRSQLHPQTQSQLNPKSQTQQHTQPQSQSQPQPQLQPQSQPQSQLHPEPQSPIRSHHNPPEPSPRTVLSVSGKRRCSSCKEELGRGAAAFVVESLNLVYHTNCFKCSVCHVDLSNGFRGVDVRVHAGALHCQNCYSKDGLNYSRV